MHRIFLTRVNKHKTSYSESTIEYLTKVQLGVSQIYSGRLVVVAAPTCAGRLIRLADSALFPPLPLSLSSLGFDFPQKLSGLVNTNVNTIITSKPFLPYCRSFHTICLALTQTVGYQQFAFITLFMKKLIVFSYLC